MADNVTEYTMSNRRSISIVELLVVNTLLVSAPAGAQETIYFADIFNPSFSSGYVRKVESDGSGLQTLVNVGGGMRGVAVDEQAGKIYWTDVNGDVIRRGNLNGSGAEDIVTEGLLFPKTIDLDLLGGKLYWGDQSLGQIGRANLDGSDAGPILSTSFASGLAVDAANRKIYWSAAVVGSGGHDGEILRADLDGANVETIVTGVGKPADIAIDIAGGKVYWTDYANDVVRRANLNGSGVEDLYIVGANLNPGGIGLDLREGKVYWGQDVATSPYVGKIMRMNLDGSDQESVAGNLGMVDDLALPAPLYGDFDDDGDTDLDDYFSFPECMTGPNVPMIAGCEAADLQADGDVDLADFGVFQAAFTG